MDFVEENITGYWSGDYISSLATADGKTAWVFSSTEIGLAKLFYTVKNGPCSQSYSLIVQVQDPAPPPLPGYLTDGADGAPGPGGYGGFDLGFGGGAPSSGGTYGTSSSGGDPPPPEDYPYCLLYTSPSPRDS